MRMSSVNKVILLGNLGAEPEFRDFSSGGRFCRLRVATSERWKDRNTGENRERTEWHSVSIFNENLIRIIEQYVRKGDKIYIEGKLTTRKWQDQQGQDRYTTEITVQNYGGQVVLLGARGGNPPENDGYVGQNSPPHQTIDTGSGNKKPTNDVNFQDDDDDEIPF